MTSTNKEYKNELHHILNEVVSTTDYPEKVRKAALAELEKGDFYKDGLYRLLLGNLSLQGSLGEIDDKVKGLDKDLNGDGKVPGIKQKIADELNERYDSLRQEVTNSITTYFTASYKTDREFLQKYMSTELTGPATNNLISLFNQIKLLREQAQADLTSIVSLGADNLLKHDEKYSLQAIWVKIRTENRVIKEQAREAEVPTEVYDAAYDALLEFVRGLELGSAKTADVDKNLLEGKFRTYYEARNDILTAIYNKRKAEVQKLTGIITGTALDYAKLSDTAYLARDLAKSLKSFLDKHLDDSTFSPHEKKRFKAEYYDKLLADITEMSQLAGKYNGDPAELLAARDELVAWINEQQTLRFMDEASLVNRDELEAKMNKAYNELIKLQNSLLDSAKKLMNSYSETATTSATKINQTDKKLNLNAETVEATAKLIESTRATFELQANKIVQGVESTTITREIDRGYDSLVKIGENLFSQAKSKAGWLDPHTGKLGTAIDKSRYSDWLKFPAHTVGTLSVRNNVGPNKLLIYWYDAEKKFIKADVLEGDSKELKLSAESPAGTAFARVATYRTLASQVQFEMSPQMSPYHVAIYDLMNDILLAQEEQQRTKAAYEKFTKEYNDLHKKDYPTAWNKLVSDNKLTADEKTEMERMTTELTKVTNGVLKHMGEYGMDSKLLEEYYRDIISKAIQITTDKTSTTKVPSLTMISKFKRYWDELLKMNNAVLEQLKKAHEKAQQTYTASQQSAIEAETAKNNLMQKAEAAARLLAKFKELIAEENAFKATQEDTWSGYMSDGRLTAIEKVQVNDWIARAKMEAKWLEAQADKFSVGKSEYQRMLSNLLDTLKPLLTLDALRDDSRVNPETMNKVLKLYNDAKGSILDNILASAKADYDGLQAELSAALKLAAMKNEEFVAFQRTLAQAEETYKKVQDQLAELRDAVPYTVRLESSRGDRLTETNPSTTLRCIVYRGNIDITNQILPENFKWTKKDKDGQVDVAWTQAHGTTTGSTLEVDHTDIDIRATFRVEVFQEVGEAGVSNG